MNEIIRNVGAKVRRYDGPLKVTGGAKYAAEFGGQGVLYGYVVSSDIPKGRITSFDLAAAKTVPGVVEIFTHENSRKGSSNAKDFQDAVAPPGVPLHPLVDALIQFAGQPVALVVAETFEAARWAAALVHVDYAAEVPLTDLEEEQAKSYDPPEKRAGIPPPPDPRGDAKAAFDAAPIKVHATYGTAIEHHNPMELFAATVFPTDAGGVKVYEKTPGRRQHAGLPRQGLRAKEGPGRGSVAVHGRWLRVRVAAAVSDVPRRHGGLGAEAAGAGGPRSHANVHVRLSPAVDPNHRARRRRRWEVGGRSCTMPSRTPRPTRIIRSPSSISPECSTIARAPR